MSNRDFPDGVFHRLSEISPLILKLLTVAYLVWHIYITNLDITQRDITCKKEDGLKGDDA